eukprot:Gb_17418 [translate_table: standard]
MNSPALITIPGATNLISASSQGIFKSGSTRSCSNIPTAGSFASVQSFSYGQWKSWTHRPISGEKKRRSTLPIRGAAAIESLSSTILTPVEEDKIQEKAKDSSKSKNREVAERWREIQGANHWQGLLDPMDDILRKEIIRYGEFARACYEGFDFDPFSKYCGSCKYNRRKLFEGVGMSDYGYEVTEYLYATSNINLPSFFQKPRATGQQLWSSHANWMGFVAVAQDENEIKRLGRRDIVIAWRGTVTCLEWMADLMDILRPAVLNPAHPHPDVKVESGFLNLYTAQEKHCRYSKKSARDQVLTEVKRLLEKYKGEELGITITGHSLGSALAMLSAYDIAEMGLNRSAAAIDEEQSQIPITVFSFAAHLHLVDGYHGRGQRFYLASRRDPALVNKACDFLKDHHLVPPFWRQDANRGLVKNSEGRWVQPERHRIDDPAHTDANANAGDDINISVNGHSQSSLQI